MNLPLNVFIFHSCLSLFSRASEGFMLFRDRDQKKILPHFNSNIFLLLWGGKHNLVCLSRGWVSILKWWAKMISSYTWLLSVYLPSALRACPRGEIVCAWEWNTVFAKSVRIWFVVNNMLWGLSGTSKYISSPEWLVGNGHKEAVQGLPRDAQRPPLCCQQCPQPISGDACLQKAHAILRMYTVPITYTVWLFQPPVFCHLGTSEPEAAALWQTVDFPAIFLTSFWTCVSF